MFYLELKNGEKIFTDKNSDDKKEFDKVIYENLGREASELFLQLLQESEENIAHVLHNVAVRYKDCITRLDKLLDEKDLDRTKLEEVLSDLQKIYTDYLL